MKLLKHVINLNTQISFTGLWKWRTGFVVILFLFSALDFWCLFTGIVVHQLWSFALSRKHEVQMREWHFTCFFGATGMVTSWVGALRKLCTLRIGSGGTVGKARFSWYYPPGHRHTCKQVYLRLIRPQDMVPVIHALGQVVFRKQFAGFFVSQLQNRLPSGTMQTVLQCVVYSLSTDKLTFHFCNL